MGFLLFVLAITFVILKIAGVITLTWWVLTPFVVAVVFIGLWMTVVLWYIRHIFG